MTDSAKPSGATQFTLVRGGAVLGTVSVEGSDRPWLFGTLQPSAAYEDVRPLFERLEQVLEAKGFGEESAAILEEILSLGVEMRAVDGEGTHLVEGISIAGRDVTWR